MTVILPCGVLPALSHGTSPIPGQIPLQSDPGRDHFALDMLTEGVFFYNNAHYLCFFGNSVAQK